MPKKLSEKEYQLIKKTLIDSGVTSTKQVEERMHGMIQSAIKYSLIGTIVIIIILFTIPKYAIFIALIYCLYMAWMWSSILSSKQYFKRYLQETNNS